jgi:hypothetical protein
MEALSRMLMESEARGLLVGFFVGPVHNSGLSICFSPLWCSRGLGALGLLLGFCGYFLGVVFGFL